MYKNGEAILDRILELVSKCPKEFQGKCFEVLLSGYVQNEVGTIAAPPLNLPLPQGLKQPEVADAHIPPASLPRFRNMAKRLSFGMEKLDKIFDFGVDPFALHAVNVRGKNNAEKTRNVALLAALRSYFAAGSWSADWQEVKSLCVDHNCYDAANHAINLKKGTGLFKSVEAGKPIELSSGGVKDAEKLLKVLVEDAS